MSLFWLKTFQCLACHSEEGPNPYHGPKSATRSTCLTFLTSPSILLPARHSISVFLPSLMFLKHTRHIPVSEPSPWLVPLPESMYSQMSLGQCHPSFKSVLQCHLLIRTTLTTLFKIAACTPLFAVVSSCPVIPFLVLTTSNIQNNRFITFTLFLSSLECTLSKGRDVCVIFHCV